MDAAVIEQYRSRITRDVVGTWASFQRRGRTDRVRHLVPAMALLAKMDGRPQDAPLTGWLEHNSNPYPPPRFTYVVEAITEGVLDRWYQCSYNDNLAKNRHILQALKHMASTPARYRRRPLVRIFEDRLKQNRETDAEATAAAIAAVAEHVPEPKEFLPILLKGAEAHSRRVRSYSLYALLQIAPILSEQPHVIAMLSLEMDRLWSPGGYHQDALRQYPVHFVEYTAKCSDLFGNRMNDFVWASAAVVLGKIGKAANNRSVVSTLEKALQSDLFVVQRVAAETLVRIGAAEAIVTRLLTELGGESIAAASLRKLGVLGSVLHSDSRILDALMSTTRHPNVFTRADAIECLSPLSQASHEIRAICIRRLEAIVTDPNWILRGVSEPVLDLFRRQLTRDQYVASFNTFGASSGRQRLDELASAQFAEGDMSGCLAGVLRAEIGDESPQSFRPPAASTNTQKVEPNAVLQPAQILLIETLRGHEAHSNGAPPSEAQAALETALKSIGPLLSTTMEVARVECGTLLLSFDRSDPVFECAVKLSQKLRLGVKMAIHRHNKITLTRDEQGQWTINGEGIAETRRIASLGKAGQIHISESARSYLPTSLENYIYDGGKIDSVKGSLGIFLLYSMQHHIGYEEIYRDRKPLPRQPRIDPQQRRSDTLRILAILCLIAIISVSGVFSYLYWVHPESLGTLVSGDWLRASGNAVPPMPILHIPRADNNPPTKGGAANIPGEQSSVADTQSQSPAQEKTAAVETPGPEPAWASSITVTSAPENGNDSTRSVWRRVVKARAQVGASADGNSHQVQVRLTASMAVELDASTDGNTQPDAGQAQQLDGATVWNFTVEGSRVTLRFYASHGDNSEPDTTGTPDFRAIFELQNP